MISLELSTIQHNRSESARLNAAMDEFLQRGGQVLKVESAGFARLPLAKPAEGSAPNPEPACKPKSKKAGMQRYRITPDIEEAEANRAKEALAKIELVRRVRELAKTMGQGAVSKGTGLTRKTLHNMAKNYGFEFTPAAHVSPSDSKNVERIKALRDVGVTRKQAARQIGISATLFSRLLRDHNIDYPKATNRFK